MIPQIIDTSILEKILKELRGSRLQIYGSLGRDESIALPLSYTGKMIYYNLLNPHEQVVHCFPRVARPSLDKPGMDPLSPDASLEIVRVGIPISAVAEHRDYTVTAHDNNLS